MLWQNLPPTHKLPDAAAVARLRDLVRSPAVKSALLHSNDTFLAFVLRAVEFVLADQFRADREIIDHLWDVLDDPGSILCRPASKLGCDGVAAELCQLAQTSGTCRPGLDRGPQCSIHLSLECGRRSACAPIRQGVARFAVGRDPGQFDAHRRRSERCHPHDPYGICTGKRPRHRRCGAKLGATRWQSHRLHEF